MLKPQLMNEPNSAHFHYKERFFIHISHFRKKIFTFSVFLFLIACVTPLGTNSAKLQVVATTNLVGDAVRIVGGEHIELTVLVPLGSDPHAYEPAPRDAALVSGADLLFVNGLGLESFLQSLLENVSNETKIGSVSDGIQAVEGEHEQENDEEQGEEILDPHVWQDPTNMMVWVENIAAALVQTDPSNAQEYDANAEAYISELKDLDLWIMDEVDALPQQRRVMVTDHEAFDYFARRYGFEIVGVVIPSVSTLASPSARSMVDLQQAIATYQVPAIFISTTTNPDVVSQLAQDLGVGIVPIFGESLSSADGPAPTYLAMMRYNVNAIVTALK